MRHTQTYNITMYDIKTTLHTWQMPREMATYVRPINHWITHVYSMSVSVTTD